VDARAIALALGIAAISTAAGADAGADRPVFVTVLGQGHSRLRLAVGITAPCNSTENRMLFDGPLAPEDTGGRPGLKTSVISTRRARSRTRIGQCHG